MRISLPSAKRKARIEIIPLIDIVFFLLATFVMVSMSMVKNQGVLVKLPVASTSAAEDRRSAVTLSITEGGDVFLNKEKILIEDLREKLQSLKEGNPEIKVFINGDERALLGPTVRVLDEVRMVGIKKVAIQTKGKK